MIKTHADKAIIDALGGPANVARRLGFAPSRGIQRVHNWTRRGIPAEVRLRHLDLFGPLPARRSRQKISSDGAKAHGAAASRPRHARKTPHAKGKAHE